MAASGLALSLPALPAVSNAAMAEPAMCAGQVVTIDLNNPNAPNPGRPESDVVLGTPNVDVIYTGYGADTICAGDGADWVDAGGGAAEGTQEQIYGEAGNDILLGTDSDELFDGGDGGADTLTYYHLAGGVTIDLMLTGPQDTGAGGVDVLVNIGHLEGTYGDDVLSGNDVSNSLDGNEGDDILIGRGGDDYLDGLYGDDTLIGGDGNDQIEGYMGTDTAYGEAGDDYIALGGFGAVEEGYGGAGRDFFEGSTVDEVLDGGDGRDTLDFWSGCRECSDDFGATGKVRVDLRLTAPQDTLGAGVDQILDIESLIGTPYNDVLLGNGANNRLHGEQGNDYLGGRRGSDYLWGSIGRDRCVGGPGRDRYDHCE